jgi:zinc transport system substrate-binding protein
MFCELVAIVANHAVFCDNFAGIINVNYSKTMLKPTKIIALIILVVAVVGVVALAVSGHKPQNDKVAVAASYYPLYDFAVQIGGSHVAVSNIAGNNEPHDFDPSPQAIITAQKANVFVYNGGHLEPWVNGFLKDYRHLAIKASTDIDLRHITDQEHTSQTVNDPHFWLDPVYAQQIARNIQKGLSTADPAHATDYAKNTAVLIGKLQQLDTEYRVGLAQCQEHTVISSHQALGYLAARYGFNVQSIAGLSPEDEPSPAKLSELSQLVREQGIHYVFFESLASQRLADTIATETGAKTLVFNPIEKVSPQAQHNGQNYIKIQRSNLVSLRTALACR